MCLPGDVDRVESLARDPARVPDGPLESPSKDSTSTTTWFVAGGAAVTAATPARSRLATLR